MPAKKIASRIKNQEAGKTLVKAPVILSLGSESEVNSARNLKIKKTESRDFSPVAQNDRTKKTGSGISIPVYSLIGKEAGRLDLPKEVFGVKVKLALLSQALRVYMNNQKTHFANTKTRGEVSLTTKKIYKQKGTGGARHGSKSAPIYVGGGIALGPKYRKVELDLPTKMKKAALVSALSQKVTEDELKGIEGLEKLSGKTKEVAKFLEGVRGKGKGKSVLFVTGEKSHLAVRAVRNIPAVDILPANLVNVFEIIRHQSVILTKEAVEILEKRLLKEKGGK